MEKKFYSVREAAQILGVAEITAVRWATKGNLRSVKVGGRRLVPVEAIAELTSIAMGGEA